MSDHKDYNIMANSGITDAEYLDMMEGPAELAGTPEINEWLINKIYEDNIVLETEAMVSGGMPAEKARASAMKLAEGGRLASRRMVAQVTKDRGY